MPTINLVPPQSSKSAGDRRHDGPSSAGNAAEPAAPLKIAGVTVRVPGWLRAWWNEFTDDKAVMVEIISRALFPLLFAIFNLLYWPWYLM